MRSISVSAISVNSNTMRRRVVTAGSITGAVRIAETASRSLSQRQCGSVGLSWLHSLMSHWRGEALGFQICHSMANRCCWSLFFACLIWDAHWWSASLPNCCFDRDADTVGSEFGSDLKFGRVAVGADAAAEHLALMMEWHSIWMAWTRCCKGSILSRCLPLLALDQNAYDEHSDPTGP